MGALEVVPSGKYFPETYNRSSRMIRGRPVEKAQNNLRPSLMTGSRWERDLMTAQGATESSSCPRAPSSSAWGLDWAAVSLPGEIVTNSAGGTRTHSISVDCVGEIETGRNLTQRLCPCQQRCKGPPRRQVPGLPRASPHHPSLV